MSDKPVEITIHTCGPSRPGCKCNCPESCEHDFQGMEDMGDGCFSSVCTKCGMSAMSHDMWVLP